MNLKESIFKIFSANLLTMLTSIIIGFIVPAILSVEGYALLKTYAFYVSYIGCLHFGFIDGMYIKYGGKDPNEIDMKELKSEHIVFLLMETIITIIFVLISFLNQNIIIFLMALSILPINTSYFHQLFYQATGQFDKYVKISYIYTITYLIMNVLLAIIFKSQNYILYCLTTLIANGIVFIILEYKFLNDMRMIKASLKFKLLSNIKVGIFILLGNLSLIMFYAIDRWFVKLLFEVKEFGYYSFAISLMNIINVLVTSISVTFYNYLSKGENQDKLIKLKKYFIILGAFSSMSYFVFSAIINLFIQKYIPALSIIAISFAAYPFIIVINILYVNLYKARKEEKKYGKVVFIMVFISFIYNMIAILLYNNPKSIAMATTLSFITWYIYSIKDFKYLKIHISEMTYLTTIFISFLVCSHTFTWLLGAIIYLLIVSIMTWIIYREEVQELFVYIFQKIK